MPEDGFRLQDSTVAIVGLGLMGGSLALALKGTCRLVGLDIDPAAREAALAKGAVAAADRDPAKVLADADVVILAAPVPAIIGWLESLPKLIDHPCVVMDIGSTKRAIIDAMNSLPAQFDPIGGHPVCGREQLGLRNADPNLFMDAPFILTPLARTTSRAREAASQILASIGARRLELSAEEHDRALAATSHLPFLASSALALATPADSGQFIGTGFRSTARLAGTPASMMLGVLASNRDNILQSLKDFQMSLSTIEAALRDEDNPALEELLDRSRRSYEGLITAS